MAVADTIKSIKTHLGEAYASLEEKGATLPTNKNIENLSDSILTVKSTPKLQQKTATPKPMMPEVVVADEGFDGLSTVLVTPIPSEYIIPEGTVNITQDGEYNVRQYEKATVNVGGDVPTEIEWTGHADANGLRQIGWDEEDIQNFQTYGVFWNEENDDDSSEEEWKEYSEALRTAQANGFSLLINKKEKAEAEMYNGVCRTERLSVMDGEDFINVKGTVPSEYLKVTKDDIQSYMQAQNLIMECGNSQNVPVDYIKSCPFLMSFMENYVLKKDIKRSFTKGIVQNIETANKPLLWLNKEQIEQYEEIPETNARLKMLRESAFENSSEKLLWCPPTKPYYELEGVYKGVKDFSKTLIFSSWEMVPKMISTLLSYEEERKIRSWKQNIKLYSEYKHTARLKLEIEKLGGKQLFSELYPSEYLADLYNPISSLNEKKSLEEIKSELKGQISLKLSELKEYEGKSGRESEEEKKSLLDQPKYRKEETEKLISSCGLNVTLSPMEMLIFLFLADSGTSLSKFNFSFMLIISAFAV